MRLRFCGGAWLWITAALAVVLTGCSATAEAAPLTSAAIASMPQTGNTVSAKVRVAPAQASDLGFLIGGQVKELQVHEGDSVEAGQALIALEARQLELAVEAAEQGPDRGATG